MNIILASFLLLIGSLGTLAAEPVAKCPHGMLNERYCDQNNDLLADQPINPEQWLDPYPLVFSYAPVEDPIIYKTAWQDFIAYLSKSLGREVVYFPIQSNAAEIEAMRSGKIHIAGFNTGSTPKAVNCAGFIPFTLMAKQDNSFGYRMNIITYPNSGIEQVTDIKGKSFVFTAPTSNSGYKAATVILRNEFSLSAPQDFKPQFSGKHSLSVLGVKNKKYRVASVASSVLKRMQERGDVKPEQIKIIYQSKMFPNTAYGVAHNLAPELAQKIKQAFINFNWEQQDGTPSSLKAEFNGSGYVKFVPIDYQQEWQIIRDIDRAKGLSLQCN